MDGKQVLPVKQLFVLAIIMLSATLLVAVMLAVGPVLAGENQKLKELLTCSGTLKQGDKGLLVEGLQAALSGLGYYEGAVDGIFGPLTKTSVTKFQKEAGLQADGLAGPKTIGALTAMYQRKFPPETHTVKPGETLSLLSDRYGVSVADIKRANGLADENRIFAGQSLSIAPVVLEPEPPKEPTHPEPVEPSVPAFPSPTKGICLTFDDGPDLLTTGPILSTLGKYGVKATFFVIGNKAEKHPELLKEISDKGHTLGIHGYEHKPLAGLPAQEVSKDLRLAQEIVWDITGQKPYLYRPPAGLLDHTQITEAARLGLGVMMWTNIGGADLGAADSEEVTERVVNSATDGGIILLHEGLPCTVEALPDLIESLARLGFGFRNPPVTAH